MNNNDRINLIHRISELEGLTDRERSALLGLLRADKAYGLVWEDKPEAVEDKMQEELPVLKEVKERALISDSKDAPNHILIEGDNLEALQGRAQSYPDRGRQPRSPHHAGLHPCRTHRRDLHRSALQHG